MFKSFYTERKTEVKMKKLLCALIVLMLAISAADLTAFAEDTQVLTITEDGETLAAVKVGSEFVYRVGINTGDYRVYSGQGYVRYNSGLAQISEYGPVDSSGKVDMDAYCFPEAIRKASLISNYFASENYIRYNYTKATTGVDVFDSVDKPYFQIRFKAVAPGTLRLRHVTEILASRESDSTVILIKNGRPSPGLRCVPFQRTFAYPADDGETVNPDLKNAVAAWVFDPAGKMAGYNLTEYGNADMGYSATLGSGRLTAGMSGDMKRALKWSSGYGSSGTAVAPAVSADGKNPWSSPYLRFELPASGYELSGLTVYLSGSHGCPYEWKLQYSYDGADFSDIEGSYTRLYFDSGKLTAYFDGIKLPSFTYGKDSGKLYIRMIPVSMSGVSDPSSGELAVGCAVIRGRAVDFSDVDTGDVDLDGVVDIVDSTFIQRYCIDLYRMDPYQLKAADTDRDGTADVTDATLLQRYIVGVSDGL